MSDALVIGAGPAGLMAAEELSRAGRRVVVAEAKASPARKFLMAGKSGLNVTRDEALEGFIARYDAGWLAPMLAEFGPVEVRDWCRGLGQEVFTGSSGRVFPKAMKASPLLRGWLRRLDGAGVEFRMRWRWAGFAGEGWRFETPEGERVLTPRVVVLALGGASWSRLGSDGAWVPWLRERGVEIAPWKPANMGLKVIWSPQMARHFGAAVKGACLRAGEVTSRGEFVVSAKGLEGGGIYAVSRAVREGAALELDLMPDVPEAEVAARLARMKPGESATNRLRKLGLSPVASALVMEWGRGQPLAVVKHLPVRHAGPRSLDEAISVAGGITRASLTEGLELRALPGVFACGEMLDWEAPTGGYLLTASWATGRWAGRAAARVG
ncbi:TIGR03862 family flavoprotein [Rhodobacter sp. Har01]|uniref:NAD(P)/FAD-dependent oxidoreductase n=1 Tax=Rhodobacter sp. Har01 TaxID=2883999 RepID=UPI001D07392C|nr:TIGR03862 family flavoprotein [Rhodobacter sp. Har01]MCB6179408.1 TIGR03862 family flavoprotein [Rhodobacter sp. Har01]